MEAVSVAVAKWDVKQRRSAERIVFIAAEDAKAAARAQGAR
jgi:hypothetical protein